MPGLDPAQRNIHPTGVNVDSPRRVRRSRLCRSGRSEHPISRSAEDFDRYHWPRLRARDS